jgi:hypothetical protein
MQGRDFIMYELFSLPGYRHKFDVGLTRELIEQSKEHIFVLIVQMGFFELIDESLLAQNACLSGRE